MKIKKLTPLFIPDSHKRICESGLSGQRYIDTVSLRGKSSKNDSDVDGIARRSRPPQMDIFNMPLTDQEKRATRCSRNKTI